MGKNLIKSRIFTSAAFFTFNVLAVFFFTKYFWHGTGSEKKNEKENEKFWNKRAFQKGWSIFVKIKQHETGLRN